MSEGAAELAESADENLKRVQVLFGQVGKTILNAVLPHMEDLNLAIKGVQGTDVFPTALQSELGNLDLQILETESKIASLKEAIEEAKTPYQIGENFNFKGVSKIR